MTRSRRCLVLLVIASMVGQQLVLPCRAHAEADAAQNPHNWRMSQTETLISASLIGAGLALIITSGVVEGKYERVTGYMDVGDTSVPVTTKGGTDTGGLLVIGAGLVFFGACFLIAPSVGNTEETASTRGKDHDPAGFKLATPVLEGQGAAIGVAHAF